MRRFSKKVVSSGKARVSKNVYTYRELFFISETCAEVLSKVLNALASGSNYVLISRFDG